ncbi:hypothetical protein [Streptomyces sp. 184]|uniref:hypothetical protein n=1 Tax=Streptomyces sp. 184 TaxID=1827526 RepID=UPI003891DEB6
MPSGTAPSSQVYAIVSAAEDEQEFTEALAAVPDDYLEDALDRFLAHVDGIDISAIPKTAIALLKLLPRFSEEPAGMIDVGRDYTALRPVRKLMQRVNPENADLVARTVYNGVESPYARLRFLTLVGTRRETEERIISPELEEALRDHLRENLKSAPADRLSSERELLLTVVQAIDCNAESGVPVIESATVPAVTARLLETSLSPSRTKTLGSVVVSFEDRIAWEALVSVFGGEDQLTSAVERLKEHIVDRPVSKRLQRAISAFDQYAAGWRPEQF